MKRRSLIFLYVLCVSVVNAVALDREAFSFTNYNLDARVEPEQHRLGVRGRITLRNDSSSPQKLAVLQISSSLDWRSIKIGDQRLQFVSQTYTSDIDHTGALSEAIVTLPEPVAPKSTVDLDIAYEGVIVLDATRLTRIGTPEAQANSIDWDQIGSTFTAVRGVGYVAWYPIATESASLSEENNLSDAIGRWKARNSEAAMNLVLKSSFDQPLLFSGHPHGLVYTNNEDEKIVKMGAFGISRMGISVPTFVQANYHEIDVKSISTVFYLPGHEQSAKSYAEAVASIDPIPESSGDRRLQVAELPDPNISEFVSDNLLLLPFKAALTPEDRLAIVYARARGELVHARRTWILEGLAHCEQAIDIETQRGRQAALSYLEAHRPLLVEEEKSNLAAKSSPEDVQLAERQSSLLQSTNETYVESKSMWVWWMLRDMIKNKNLDTLMLSYNPADDKEPSYMQRLIEKRENRDLEWFFDDWVYRDRGLPDFKIESVFARKTLPSGYMLTITVANLGAAGAEVPVIVKPGAGESSKRIEVRGKGKAVIRMAVSALPAEVTVNDGSVPESDTTNNTFKVEAAAAD
jgi:hypothetical protein